MSLKNVIAKSKLNEVPAKILGRIRTKINREKQAYPKRERNGQKLQKNF